MTLFFYSPGPVAPHLCSFMYYVYIIKSAKDGDVYIGYSDDLARRFDEHNKGKVFSTKNKIPWQLIYYESYKAKADAKYREDNLKRFAKAYGQLKGRIRNSLK
jgi:putative endonuclease